MGKLASIRQRHGRLLRYLAVAAGVLLVIAILGGIKGAQIGSLMAMAKKAKADGPPPEAVGTATATSQIWERTLSAVGSVSGVRSVVVSNELPGKVSAIHFESGKVVKTGEALIELDAGVERAQLAAAKARLDLAETKARRFKILAERDAIPRSQWDEVQAEVQTATADYEGIKAQVGRKTVRAPFAGRLGIRAVNVGQYLAPGTPITTLDALDASFVDFTLPQEERGAIKVGLPIRVTVPSRSGGGRGDAGGRERGGESVVAGEITAIDPTVDPSTRSLQVRARLPPLKIKPSPGMFVSVEVLLPKTAAAVVVPATAIVHAPYGDSVFVVEDKPPGSPGMTTTPAGKTVKVARQQFVRTGVMRGDFIAVTKGVSAGQQVVTAGAFKLRNKSPVVVDNRVKPTPELEPQPEER
jgi:membrane fusion protein (multidrug efflux system)